MKKILGTLVFVLTLSTSTFAANKKGTIEEKQESKVVVKVNCSTVAYIMAVIAEDAYEESNPGHCMSSSQYNSEYNSAYNSCMSH